MKRIGLLILGILVFAFASCTEEPYEHHDMHNEGHHMMDWKDTTIDKNDDQKITREEWKEYNEERFKSYDKNNDGVIDSEEYHPH